MNATHSFDSQISIIRLYFFQTVSLRKYSFKCCRNVFKRGSYNDFIIPSPLLIIFFFVSIVDVLLTKINIDNVSNKYVEFLRK